MRRKLVVLMLLFPYFLSGWDAINTEHFTLIYPDITYHKCALQQLAILEHYRPEITSFAQNDPGHTVVYIEEMGTVSNGFAAPFVNSIHNFAAIPYPEPRFGGMASWWRTVGVHEYTHIANMSLVRGISRIPRCIFGKIWGPNQVVPTWVAESYTVYLESQLYPFEGRLNEGFYDAYALSSARENRFPTLADITAMPARFPYGTMAYLWGGLFAEYRAKHFGKEHISDWAHTYGGTLPLLDLGWSYRRTYDTWLGNNFNHMAQELRERASNLSYSQGSTRLYANNEYISFLVTDGNFLYFKRHRILRTAPHSLIGYDEIVQLDPKTGRIKIIANEPVLGETPIRVHNNKIYYTVSDMQKGGKNITMQGFRIINDIFKIDTKTGSKDKVYSDNGTLKAFDVLSDNRLVLASQTSWRGGCIEMLDIESHKREILFNSESICPLDVVTNDKDKIAAILHDEDRGSKICILGGDTVDIETPFAKSGLQWHGDSLIFASNRNGTWQTYLWTGSSLLKLTDLLFCSYPLLLDSKLYYIGLTATGETVEEVTPFFSEEVTILDTFPTPTLPGIGDITYIRGGMWNNFRYLLWDPVLRLPVIFLPSDNPLFGFIGLGVDASLGRMLYYQVGWEKTEEGDFPLYGYGIEYVSSADLTPATLFCGVGSNEDFYTACGLDYPILLSYRKGLEELSFSTTINYIKPEDAQKRFPIEFSSRINFAGSRWRLNINPKIVVERNSLGSGLNRTGYYFEGKAGYGFDYGSLKLNTKAFSDKENPDTLYLSLFSGAEELASSGISLFIASEHHLFDIRKGFWYPPLYFDGVWFMPFIETAYSPRWENAKSAVGSLLSLELTMTSYLNLSPSVGASYSIEEGKWHFIWSIAGEINSAKLGLTKPLRNHLRNKSQLQNIYIGNMNKFPPEPFEL